MLSIQEQREITAQAYQETKEAAIRAGRCSDADFDKHEDLQIFVQQRIYQLMQKIYLTKVHKTKFIMNGNIADEHIPSCLPFVSKN